MANTHGPERALHDELLERLPVGGRAAGHRVGQHDLRAARLAEGDPAVAAGGDVLRDRQAERVPVERERGLRVGDGDGRVVQRDRHGADARPRASRRLLGSCSPRGAAPAAVTSRAVQSGISASAGCSAARYAVGVMPTISVNRLLNEPSEVQPTRMHASVTDAPCAQQRARPLDPPRHQVLVRALAVHGAEPAAEVRGREVHGGGDRRHVERLREVAGRSGRGRGGAAPAPAVAPGSCAGL